MICTNHISMQVRFLGTGTSQGIPIINCTCATCTSEDTRDKRLRTSIHIQTQKTSIVVDTGPDFRQQMLRAKAKKLDAVVFTHQHKDHTAGLDDIRPFYFAQGQKPIPVYLHSRVLEQLKKEFAYMFEEPKYPGVPSLDIHLIDKHIFEIGDISIEPIEVFHHKLPVLGFRIGRFAYVTDVNSIPKASKEKLYDLDVLVLGVLQKENHISHFNLEEGLAVVEELKPKKAYFTHLSHTMGTHTSTEKLLSKRVSIAYDGLCLAF